MDASRNSSPPYKILNDSATADANHFNFDVYSDSIQNIILNPEIKTPFTLVINGKWGSGKTSLMRTLKKKLDTIPQPNSTRCVKTVWFNAWKYSEKDNLLAELAFEIYQTVISEKGQPRFKKIKHCLKRIWFFVYHDKWINYDLVITDFIKASTPSGGIGIGPLSLKVNSLNTQNWLEKPFYEKNLTFYNRFQQYLDSIIHVFVIPEVSYSYRVRQFSRRIIQKLTLSQSQIQDDNREGILVIFIDDLDRCSPTAITTILESINLFFDQPGCFFVFGLDVNVVSAAIDIQYKEFELKGIFSGNDYIKKMFQLQFDLPDIRKEEMKTFLEKELGVDDSINNTIELIIESFEGNPREIKRFINSLSFLRVLKATHPNLEIDDELLSKWILLTFVSPKFVQEIKKTNLLLLIVQNYARLDTHEFTDYLERINDVTPLELFKSYKNNSKIFKILYAGKKEFTKENIPTYIFLSSLSLSDTKKNSVSIVVTGDGSYYFGEQINISGTSLVSDNIFLFIEGPGLNSEGVSLDNLSKNVINEKPESFTKIKVEKDRTWKYEWSPLHFKKYLKKGVYSIFAVNQPLSKKYLKNAEFATVTIILKEPFITGNVSSISVAQGDELYIRGIAEGNPPKINIWIFGSNYHKHKYVPVNTDSSYEYRLHRDLTTRLNEGEYFVVIQHPMANKKFDVILDNESLIGIWDKSQKYPASNESAITAVEKLVELLNNPMSDDTYTRLSFKVESPYISLPSINKVKQGTIISLLAKTNIALYNEIHLSITPLFKTQLSPAQMKIIKKQEKSIPVQRGLQSKTIVEYKNIIPYVIDTTDFPIGEYKIQLTILKPNTTATQNFTISNE